VWTRSAISIQASGSERPQKQAGHTEAPEPPRVSSQKTSCIRRGVHTRSFVQEAHFGSRRLSDRSSAIVIWWSPKGGTPAQLFNIPDAGHLDLVTPARAREVGCQLRLGFADRRCAPGRRLRIGQAHDLLVVRSRGRPQGRGVLRRNLSRQQCRRSHTRSVGLSGWDGGRRTHGRVHVLGRPFVGLNGGPDFKTMRRSASWS
jgi:hypothetical protein